MDILRLFGISAVLLLISACGGGGGGGSTPTPNVPAPSVSFSANPTSVVVGSDSTLTWSSTNATSCSASDAWSGARATSGTETVTISDIGNTSFTITCSGEGGNRSATVTIEGYRQTDGVVVDGYISGADVFIDENDNFVADASENSTTSDNEGKFTIKYADGSLISLGGTDLDSQTLLDNLLITHKMTGHSDFKAVTPVTSVAAFMQDASSVNAALGIDAAIDIFTFDPVANKGDGGINDYLYEKGNQLTVLAFALQNIVNDLNATTETTQDYFKAIAEEVDAEFANNAVKVDIETSTFITNVINNILTAKSITMDESIKANTITALAGVLPIIQVQSTDDLTTAIIRFSLSTLQADIVGVANGTATQELINSYTSDILNYIAEDQNIDSDEITPDITAIADEATVEEDGSVTINVVANDSFTTTAPIGVSADNGTNGSTTLAESSPEQVVYTPNADFNGTDTFTYTITQGDKTSSAEVTVTVSAVNDAPSIDIASTIQVPENQTVVTTVSVSDVDEDELTLTLGGTDASSFNLSGENALTFKEEPDYETKTSYGITLSLTDGTETVTKDLTITITNVNDNSPIISAESSYSILENQTSVATISASDADGDSLQFAVSAYGNLEVRIDQDGNLFLANSPDYEADENFTFATVVVSDGSFSTEKDIEIYISNVNDNAPQFSGRSANPDYSSDENEQGQLLSTLQATDADGDSFSFSVDDSDTFRIDSDNRFFFRNGTDYESGVTLYTPTISVSDGLNSTSLQLNITILDVNEPITFTSPTTYTIDENTTEVGTVTATDPEGDAITIGLSGVPNDDTSKFTINSEGLLTLRSSGDYETQSSYTLRAQGFDEGNREAVGHIITVNLNDVNDAPSIDSSSSFIADENQTDIGSVIASDEDGDSLVYSVISDDIAISSDGILAFIEAPNYEVKDTYTATVRVGDGEVITTQDITILIQDVNDTPVVSAASSIEVNENNTAITNINASDEDGDTLTYSITGGSDRSVISIDQNGLLSFVTSANYESPADDNEDNLYNIIVKVSDGNSEWSGTFNITVKDVNEAPTIGSNYPNVFEVNENATLTNYVLQTACGGNSSRIYLTCSNGEINLGNGASQEQISDEDGDTLSYSIGGDDADKFAITQNGSLYLLEAGDYETQEIYNFTLNVSDGEFTTSKTSKVQFANVNEKPTITTDENLTIEENSTVVATIVAEDPEGDVIEFALATVAGSGDTGSFLINSSSGELSFRNAPDYEEKNSYTVYVEVSDPNGSGLAASLKVFTVNVTNLNDNNPSFTSDATLSAAENQTSIDTVTATDADGDSVTFTISGSELEITSGGVLTFASTPDYETKNNYTATVTASDGANSTTQDITVNVTNENDNSPDFTSSATFSAAENQTAIGTVTATDADGDDLTFTVSGGELEITSAGVLTFVSEPDYETKTSYTATVTASDGTNSTTQDITVNILNNDETDAPVLTNLSFNSTSIDVTEDVFNLVVSINVEDESGIDTSSLPIPRILRTDGGGLAGSYFDASDTWVITSGTNKNGIISANFVVPKLQSTGDYYLWTKTIRDKEGNTVVAYYTSEEYLLSITGSEGTKPTITYNSISPTSVDVTQSSASVTVSITLEDASGINTDTLPNARLIKVDGGGAAGSFFDSNAAWSLTSGNSQSGTYEATFTVPKDQSSGSYYLWTGAIFDIYDNANQLNTSSILTVYGSEGVAPSLSNPAISVSQVNVINESKTVSVTLEFSDASGIDTSRLPIPRLIEKDSGGASGTFFDAASAWSVSSGTIKEGVLSATFNVPKQQLSGSYYLWTEFIYDIYDNAGQLNSSPLLTVINNAAPSFTSDTVFSADENQTTIGTVTATDAESDTLTFSISSNDININSATGVIEFISAPDYESQPSYTATVSVNDGVNLAVTQDITVNVTDVNDNSPVFTSNATFSAEENQTAIGTVVASDADGDGIAYSISGSDITIDASSGVIAFVSAPDYETTTSYSATVTASDGSNSATQDITVNIQNIPDVSGVAYASRYSVMDSDIPNTDYLAYSDNDFIDTAQSLTNPSIVTGHVGGDDTWDIFSVSTTSSMYVNLDVIDYIDDTKELRVYIYNSDGSSRETSYTSASIEQNMTVLLPDSGDYLIVVDDLYGSSNYILTLGQRYSSSTYEASTDFIPDYIPNELIGYTPHNYIGPKAKDNISEEKIRQIEAEKSDLFNLTGETFDRPGVKKFNIRSINGLQPSPSDDINDTNRFGNGSFGIAPLTQRQKDYYNAWSYLQKLRKISSETIFDFNYEFETTAFSRDPEYNKQWNLERVQLEPALNSLGQDLKDVAVAVIDSGGPTPGSTAWNESNLIDGGYDFIYGNSNSIDYYATSSYSGSKSSHGTHVSTTIAAKNNNVGINGYAVKALNINVFNNPTDETSTTTSPPVIDAILYAAGLENSSNLVVPSDTPIKVINLSLKSSGNILYTLALCSAVADAYNQGISIVAAAGNDQDTDPGSISYPASCAGAISVGATNSSGNISFYSQQNEYVDISAPGGGSSDLDGDGSPDWILAYGNDSQLKQLQGTSMASPQVAAAIALMYSVDSTLTPARVDNMLANGELTDDRGISGKDNAFGYGELNLAKATRNIQEDVGISVSFGYTSTSFLEFGSEATELTIDLIKIGETSLSFSSLTSSNATGLSYNATSTDAEGFGTYTLFIDRSSIPNGEYSTVINFNLSDGSKIAVRVYYNVGSLRSLPNIGKVFIGMYDASDDSLWGSGELEVDGSVSFIANDVSPGDYYIVTSTDINDNNTVCEYGELCEYYPRLSETATYFTVSDSNLTGYEIYLNPLYKYGGPNAASLSSNSQLSNINNNIAKQKNITGIGKILINSISPAIPDNPSKKGKNPVIPE